MIFLKYHFDGFLQTAVEAVNDGKIASWEMHRYLQVAFKILRQDTCQYTCLDGVQTRY